MEDVTAILDPLNDAQREAVTAAAPSVLVLAGVDANGAINLKVYAQETSLFGDSTLTESPLQTFTPAVKADRSITVPTKK